MTQIPCEVLSADCGRLVMSAYGATLMEWTPRDHEPVLFRADTASYAVGDVIHGGVPICFPWFALGPEGDQLPLHGTAASALWHRMEGSGSAAGLCTAYQLAQDDLPGSMQPFVMTLSVTAAEDLHLRLTVRNTGDESFCYEQALHSYFAVGDVRQVSVDGLQGAPFYDKVIGADGVPSDQPVRFPGKVDKVYRSAASVRIVDPVLARVVQIDKSRSMTTVVWNPAREQDPRLDDLREDDWSRFVCVEGGNVGADLVTLAPGEEHTLGYRVRVSTL